MMKYIWLILLFSYLSVNLFAFTVRGTVKGLNEGEMVYLMSSETGFPNHKWSLKQKIDSCLVIAGQFSFQVPDAEFGQMWLVRTQKKMIKYFFSKNEDLVIEGVLAKFKLNDEKSVCGKENVLMNDIFAMLEISNPTPIEKRASVDWFKRHAADDIAVYALAYFYMQNRKLGHRETEEIIPFFSSEQHKNPYYKTLIAFHKEYGAIQVEKVMENITLKDKNGVQQIVPEIYRGNPLLIYSCIDPNDEYLYGHHLANITPLLEEYPDLSVVLIYPTFKNAEHREKLESLKNERIFSFALPENISPINLNVNRTYYGCILLDSSGCILSISNRIEEIKKALNSPSYKEGYEINAYVEGIGEGIAELVTAKEGTLGNPIILDTAIIQNGYFTFKGVTPRPKYYNIGIRGTAFPVGFFLENSAIEVNIRTSKSATPQGEETCLSGSEYGSLTARNYRDVMELESDTQIEEWIKTHPDDIPTLFHMATAWVSQKSPETLEKWLKIFAPEMKQYFEYNIIVEQINKRKKLAVGQTAPDFILPDMNGEKIALKKFKGKYLLIDFWASWCEPCRTEIPHLKKIYEKYHDKGLEIISITIDRDEQAWRKALTEEAMPWLQLNANKTDITKRYNVQGIPHILLLNKKGDIIAEKLRGEKLEKALEKIIK